MKTGRILIGLSTVVTQTVANAQGIDTQTLNQFSAPYTVSILKEGDNAELFKKYCVGDPDSAATPLPNYASPLVMKAAQRLTDAKNAGNEALSKKAMAEIVDTMKRAKKAAEDLLESYEKQKDEANVKNVKNIIYGIRKSLETPAEGFSAHTLKSYGLLVAPVFEKIQKNAGPLSEALTKELKGINYQVLSQTAAAIAAEIKASAAAIDYKAITKASDELAGILKASSQPVDMKAAIEAVKVLKLGFEKLADAKSVFDNLKYLEEGITGPNATPTELAYSAAYVLDAIDQYNKSTGKKLETGKGKEAYDTLRAQHLNASTEGILKNIDEVKKQASGSSVELQYAIQNLVYEIEKLKSQNEQIIAKMVFLKSEQAKFIATNAIQSAEQVVSLIKSGKTDESLGHTWQVQEYLNVATTEKLKALKVTFDNQLALQPSESVLSELREYTKNIEKAQGKLTDEVIGNVLSFEYSLAELQKSSSLSDGTKKLIGDAIAISKGLSPLSEISTLLNTPAPNKQSANHFYFYKPVTKIYNASLPAGSPAAPKEYASEAHTFLTQLCGEYRDRATMIEAKLNWATRIHILPAGEEKTFTLDLKKEVWEQLPAWAYSPYLQLSSNVFEAKRDAQPRTIKIGAIDNIDNPVPGFTVCETKYMIGEYVGKGKEFDDAKKYFAGLKTFEAKCSEEDKNDFYDFRGDSNFKHYSPESNGMLWYAIGLAAACKDSTSVAAPGVSVYSNNDCQNYFKRPFNYRYNAARAGLATWLFYDKKHESVFANSKKVVEIYPHRAPHLAPFEFKVEGSDKVLAEFDLKWLNYPQSWSSPDIGFNYVYGIGTGAADKEGAMKVLTSLVDRHTDWYASRWNDRNGQEKNQAYSPFVASSYVMSASDGFTRCGTTVQCPDDGLKRWMMVFRVKGKNWYNPARLLNNEPVDFDRMWFDETSFGNTGLANSENAWDRLGSPMEDELDSILYLVNVNADGYEGGH